MVSIPARSSLNIAHDVMDGFRMATDEISGESAADFLAGGGEMGALMRETDWTRTPLGPPQHWPISLKTAVGIMLTSRYAMFVWWGRHLTNIYNDAYRPFLGKKHPDALGRSARNVWAEIWDQIGPRTEAVLGRAESTLDEALLLVMDRFGYSEETYFTFSYSPLRNDHGEVGGIFAAVTDETSRVIGERRLRLLRETAAASSQANTPEQVCAVAAECISQNARDLPFALLYLAEPDAKTVRLVAQVGVEPGAPGAPPCVELGDGASQWPFVQAVSDNAIAVVDDLSSRFERLPTGAWDRAPDRAAVVPLSEQGQTGVAGFLIVGLNPYLVFDEEYRGFIGLLAGQVAAGIANAQAYQEERRRAEALAEIDRAKTTFFSNISHEFRTPLTLILGSLEDLLAKPPDRLTRDCYDLGAVAQRNSLRLLNLVNTLLDFSRIEAGRVQACYERSDLGPLTAELVSNFQSACEKAGLSLDIDCPPLDEPVYVDHDMWEKVVLNLVSNAFKYTHSGGINVGLRRDGSQAALSVRDTGIGISADEIPHLFERFHRVEGARGRTHEGTGIGLALVQELTKLHQGSVDVISTIGQGTTFTVRLPFGTDHLPPAQIGGARTRTPSRTPTSTRADAFVSEALRWLPNTAERAHDLPVLSPQIAGEKRPRILVADDNADMREYLRRVLAARYDVTAVSDGKEALVIAARVHPDLVLTDVMMPSLDGFAMLQQMRADPSLQDIPVIVLSARAGEEAKIEGLRMGADDYIVKPFNARELLARVSSILDLAQARRREAEKLRQEVQQLDARYRLMVDAVTDYAIFMLDANGIVTSWNAGARRFKGYDDAEIIGQHFSRFYTAEDQAAGLPARALATARREGKFEGEGWRVRKNGERFWAHVVVDTVRGRDDQIIGFTKITRDITERHEAQRALEIARDRVLQAQKMEAIGQLTGGIAHDFNNLLTAILGSLELLQRRIPEGLPQLMRLVDNAIRGAQRGAALTQRMLAFARRQELKLEAVDVSALVRGMTELLERSIGPTIMIETRFPLGLARVTADPNQLEMALLNLIVNARDAMANGGAIVVSARPASIARSQINDLDPGEYVCLSVIDTGEGMDEGTLARAMDPFFTTKGPDKGTGLGLPMVHGLAQQSGGRLFLNSRKGEGTTAELWLPIAKQPTAVNSSVAAEPEKKQPTQSLAVVVVDDDSLVLTNMAAMLEDLGHRVFEASCGRKALEILHRESTIDLVITDHAMPQMTGLQLIQQIQAEWPAMPVILATGYAELPPDADPDLPKLAKPFFQHDLLQAVDSAVHGGRSATRVLQFRQLGGARNS